MVGKASKPRLMIAGLFALFLIGYPFGEVDAADPQLLLFGGKSHKDFLGCLNCPRSDSSSVWNPSGNYGSKFRPDSIWNKFGTYGNKFSAISPWNKFSTTAPVVVDRAGNFYGYFSANKLHPKRTTIGFLVLILDNYEWIIDNVDDVRDDVSAGLGTTPRLSGPGPELPEIIQDHGPYARTPFLSMWADRYRTWSDSYGSDSLERTSNEDAGSSTEDRPSGEILIEGAENIDRDRASKVLVGSSYFGNFSRRGGRDITTTNKEPTSLPMQSRPFIVLKDGSRLEGILQKYEKGLAFVLIPNASGTKYMLTTLPSDQVDQEATAEAQKAGPQ